MAKFEIWSKEYEKEHNQHEVDVPAVDIPSDIPTEDSNNPEIIDPVPEDQLPEDIENNNQ